MALFATLLALLSAPSPEVPAVMAPDPVAQVEGCRLKCDDTGCIFVCDGDPLV